jgi:hypothetical protein
MASLRNLNLYNNTIGDEGAKALTPAILASKNLEQLNVGKNGIGATGATTLASALEQNPTLTSLSLRGNHIRDDGARALSGSLLINTKLRVLDLRDNGITADGARLLADCIEKNGELLWLRLSPSPAFFTGAGSSADPQSAEPAYSAAMCRIDRAMDRNNCRRVAFPLMFARMRLSWCLSLQSRLGSGSPAYCLPDDLVDNIGVQLRAADCSTPATCNLNAPVPDPRRPANVADLNALLSRALGVPPAPAGAPRLGWGGSPAAPPPAPPAELCDALDRFVADERTAGRGTWPPVIPTATSATAADAAEEEPEPEPEPAPATSGVQWAGLGVAVVSVGVGLGAAAVGLGVRLDFGGTEAVEEGG